MTDDPTSEDNATITIDGVQTPIAELSWWRRPRRLRRQLVATLLGVAFLSVALVGALNYIAGRSLLDQGTQDQLAGIGEARSRSIETGVDNVSAQLSVAATDLAVIDAVESFTKAFDDLQGAAPLAEAQVRELEDAYQTQVIDPIVAAGLGPVALDDIFPTSQAATYLQYHYVFAGEADRSSRRDITDAGDGSEYSAVHATAHATLATLADNLGFGDILIVSERTDEVVYSVDKRIDLGTDLGDGPLATSALAETVLSSLTRVPVGSAVIADQGIYIPGGGQAVVFVAANVRRGTEVIGTLVAEIPAERINVGTTAGGEWEAVGLGAGESYIVSADRLLRSESRLWIEDPERYLAEIEDESLRKQVEAFGSPVGLQPVETTPASTAFEGRVFEGIARNYLDRRTFSYATPIDAPGVDWVVVTDVPLNDARGPLTDYTKRLGLVLLIILPAAGAVGYVLADRLTRPIPPVVDAAFDVAGGDRDPRVPDLGRDEFGDLARRLKQMAQDLETQEDALAEEYERTRQLLLTVLPPRIVDDDGGLDDDSDISAVATVVAVGVDLAHADLDVDEQEFAALMDRIRAQAEATAAGAGVERVRAAADRYLFLAGLQDSGDGADLALEFTEGLTTALRSLAVLEDAPLRLHVGLATGPVATGVLQRGSLTFGAWGEPVRRAMAVSALSGADQVLIDDSTAASLTDQRWSLTPAEQIHGLGDDDRIMAHALITDES